MKKRVEPTKYMGMENEETARIALMNNEVFLSLIEDFD